MKTLIYIFSSFLHLYLYKLNLYIYTNSGHAMHVIGNLTYSITVLAYFLILIFF